MVFFQKFIARQLWQMAQSNFERTENITKELVQALEAKDTFISSFSHEIRNPLNSINGSIDYLSRVIKDPAHLEVLEHAKISAEVLLNLISNILDAAKLKSEKMELLHNETNPIEIIKKVLTVNSSGLARKGIFAQCLVDKHLPKKLILDSSRILQIIMNLFSNSIKFTPDNGRIQLHMVWCPLDKPQEELLQPIETKFPDKTALSSEESPMLKADLFNGHRHTSADHQQGTTAYSSRARSRATLDSLGGSPINESCDEFNQIETRSRMDNIKHLHDCKKVKGMSQVYSFHSHINENYEILSLNNLSSKTLQSLDELSNCLVQDDKTGPRGYLKVQISDTGCGISEANLPKLFCAFSQADATISRHYGGTGLGLWISKQLCQKMGGNIAVYSKVDQGTTFVFYIEVANGMSAQTTPVNEFRSLKSKVRALVVDDHAYSRDLHKLLLEREGVEVHLAKDGREAVRKYETRCEDYYDFIMMDIQMPVMDGLKAAQMMRLIEKERETKHVDIYFVSGNYYGSEAEKLVENISNTQFLRKPVNIEAIKKIVEIYGGLLKEHSHLEEGRRSERRSSSRRNTAFYNEWFKKRNASENLNNGETRNRNLHGLIKRLSRISLT